MKGLLYIIVLSTLCLGQTSYLGLNTWTQSNVVGLSGGGYLINAQNDFRNAAMLVKAKRHIKFDVIKYPAGISSQSMAGATQINNNYLGFMVSRIYLHCLLRKRTVEETGKVEIVVEEEVVVIIHVDNS